MRLAVLVAADLGTFCVLRSVRRALAGFASSQTGLGQAFLELFPEGYLRGWQYGVALILGLMVTGSYGKGDRRRDAARLVAGCALATALPLWSALWSVGLGLVFFQFVVTSIVVSTALVIERHLLDRAVSKVLRRRAVSARTLVVACTRDCGVMSTGGGHRGLDDFEVVHVVEICGASSPPVQEQLRKLPDLLARHRVEAVSMCGHLRGEEMQLVADAAMAAGCQLLFSPRAFEIAGVQPKLVWRRGAPLLELTAPTLLGQGLVLKRVLDIVGAALGLILLSPVFAVVGLLVKLSSPGPVLFGQERVGQGGLAFRIWKFRTMVANAEDLREELRERSVYQDARLFKIPEDPRLTPVGRFLRRRSLDELPQLWNVLRGEMSLVGPRPPLPSEVELYEAHHYVRFDVRPGITGPWQVAGRNQITDFEEVIALETSYIREWSIWRDFAILARTMGAVVRMRGAH